MCIRDRDGEQQKIQSEELVKDDIIILSAGNQICADATVLSGSISVNEAPVSYTHLDVYKRQHLHSTLEMRHHRSHTTQQETSFHVTQAFLRARCV